MYTYNLAYRHDTGEVEGFVGTAFDKSNAREAAIRKVIDQVRNGCLREYHAEQVIESFDGLAPEEKTQIEEDWKVIAKSNKV